MALHTLTYNWKLPLLAWAPGYTMCMRTLVTQNNIKVLFQPWKCSWHCIHWRAAGICHCLTEHHTTQCLSRLGWLGIISSFFSSLGNVHGSAYTTYYWKLPLLDWAQDYIVSIKTRLTRTKTKFFFKPWECSWQCIHWHTDFTLILLTESSGKKSNDKLDECSNRKSPD